MPAFSQNRFSLVVALLFIASINANAQTYTQWKASNVDSLWKNPANWNDGVPSASKSARVSNTDYNPHVPVPQSDTARTYDLEIQSSGFLHFDSLGVLVVHGSQLTITKNGEIRLGHGKIISKASIRFFNGGDFYADAGTLEFAGVQWENKAGSAFDPGTSTVIFNGTGSQTLIINDTASFSFYNLQISSGGTVTISGDLVVNGDCILDPGSSISVSAGGSLKINGTFYGDPNAVSGDSVSLPVQLSSFTVSANRLDAVLNWSTASEVNNFGFEIERRRMEASKPGDVGAWQRIGFVRGAGSASQPNSYSYTDANLPTGRYAYRLKQIDFDGTTSYYSAAEIEVGIAPKQLVLSDNYPNPFNPSTRIEFTIPENGRAKLSVYNMIGQHVATLFDQEAQAGRVVQATFSAPSLASGIYFYQLEYGTQRLIKRMLLVK